jgi:hypothetical protein
MKYRFVLGGFVLVVALSLGGCAFLTPNWGAIHPSASATPSPSETPQPITTPTPSTKPQPVQVEVVASTVDASGISVVAQASNVSEDGGKCTLTVSQAATRKVVVVGAESNVVDTQCFPLNLPLTGFVSGAATFTVQYLSSTHSGISAIGQLVIP